MKAIVIQYMGSELPMYVQDSIVNGLINSGIVTDNNIIVHALNEDDIAKKLCESVSVVPEEDQEALNKAAAYISESVLKRFKNPKAVEYAIIRHICCGDERMKTAVEIIATTKNGRITEPGFDEVILSVINTVHKTTNIPNVQWI